MSDLAVNVFNPLDTKLIEQVDSWESAISFGLELRTLKDKSCWCLGLLALKVESKYGEDSIGKFAKEIGIQASSLRVYRYVVYQFLKSKPDFVPPEKLSFGVLQSIAHLPEATRNELIISADDEGWSVELTRIRARQKQGKPVTPQFKIVFCNIHGKYQFIPKDISQFEPYHE